MSASTAGSLAGGVLLLVGSLFFLVTAVGMMRARDAISRVNNLSPATGAGLPLIILGAVVHHLAQDELTVTDGVKAVLAIGASLAVSSVASNMLGRAAYRTQRELDPRTVANALETLERPEPPEPSSGPEDEVSADGDPGTGDRA
ncbi:cation:proton antiporter [Nocardioides sp. SYSU DS0663]|uniref:cation:proton antiporter n=1 Tax=Nocardioides sp. SYSU DS0663 TaxID=3416445 RepID=UPI003F4B5A28